MSIARNDPRLSCPKCHLVDTVRPAGDKHYICDSSITETVGDGEEKQERHGCNAQFYLVPYEDAPDADFEDKYIHFPFNIIFDISTGKDDTRPTAREKREFYRKPCIHTVPPFRITSQEINPEEQEACRRGCPDLCQRVHCPKNPAKIFCVDPKTGRPTDPPCTLFPDCNCDRVVPPTMWQCVWDVERKCPDEPLVIESLNV